MLLTLVVTLVHFSVVPAGVPSIGNRVNRLNRIFSEALSDGSGWASRIEDCDAFLVLEGPTHPLPQTSCRVLYSNASGGIVEGQYDVILTNNRSVVPFMERKGNVYYFDPTHYEEKNIQLLLEKDHLLSVVLPRDFVAQRNLQDLVVNATEIMPDHVYVEGSSSYSRMFKRYRFTLLYGGLDDGEFPPRVLVEAMAHHTIPLVPVGEMKKVIPFHFHMGEAVWGIYSLELPAAIVMLEDLMANEKKEENVFYRLETQRMTQDVFQYRYHLPIETRLHAHVCTLCQIYRGRQGLAERSVVFVGIFSARRNFLLRQTLRQTWVSLLRRLTFDSGRVDYRFFIGKGPEEVSREQAAYGDLVELDVWDTYRNVTLKSLRMFQYVTERWSEAVYFLRVDDDVYL
ncbi:Beta-1,3-galactosyltransferase 5, partial [Perkinsus olseni]